MQIVVHDLVVMDRPSRTQHGAGWTRHRRSRTPPGGATRRVCGIRMSIVSPPSSIRPQSNPAVRSHSDPPVARTAVRNRARNVIGAPPTRYTPFAARTSLPLDTIRTTWAEVSPRSISWRRVMTPCCLRARLRQCMQAACRELAKHVGRCPQPNAGPNALPNAGPNALPNAGPNALPNAGPNVGRMLVPRFTRWSQHP